jgi:HEAT repeat protein
MNPAIGPARLATASVLLWALTMIMPMGGVASDWMLQWEEVERLAASEEPEATDVLRDIAAAAGASPWLKGRVLVSLAKRDGVNVRADVLAAAVSSNAVMRRAACEALGILGDGQDLLKLRGMLKDSDEATGYASALALSRVEGADAWQHVASLAKRPTETFVEQQVQILGNTFVDAGTNLLRHLLIRTNAPAIRLRSARALHRTQAPGVMPLLLQCAVTDRDKMVRVAAESSLRCFDAEFLSASLAGVFKSDDEAFYPLAAKLLLLRPSETGGDALAALIARRASKLRPKTLSLSMDALLAIDPARYRDTIGKYLEDKDPTMRMRAVTALAVGRPDHEVYQILREPLADPHDGVFRHALRILEKRTEFPPQEGLVPYLAPYIAETNANRTPQFLDVMKRRLLPEDAAAALDVLRPHLRGADAKLRQSAMDVFKSTTDEVIVARAMGAQGYVTRWLVVGPFDNDRRNSGFKTKYPPELTQDLDATYDGTTRSVAIMNDGPSLIDDVATSGVTRVTWNPMSVAGDGSVRLNRLLMRVADYLTAYALAEIHLPEEQQVEFHLKGDDAFKVWLNGEEVVSVADPPIPKDPKPDRLQWEDIMRKWMDNPHDGKVSLKLKKGRNRILVKVSNYIHGWYFSLRITHPDGSRADFEEIELKKIEE